MFRELLQFFRECFDIQSELSGHSRKIEFQDVTPEIVAEASRKKEELRRAWVMSYLRIFLFFMASLIILPIADAIMPVGTTGLLMIPFAVGFTYLGMYMIIETNRYYYFRCPRCGCIFRDRNRVFRNRDRCRVCDLNLEYQVIGQSNGVISGDDRNSMATSAKPANFETDDHET